MTLKEDIENSVLIGYIRMDKIRNDVSLRVQYGNFKKIIPDSRGYVRLFSDRHRIKSVIEGYREVTSIFSPNPRIEIFHPRPPIMHVSIFLEDHIIFEIVKNAIVFSEKKFIDINTQDNDFYIRLNIPREKMINLLEHNEDFDVSFKECFPYL